MYSPTIHTSTTSSITSGVPKESPMIKPVEKSTEIQFKYIIIIIPFALLTLQLTKKSPIFKIFSHTDRGGQVLPLSPATIISGSAERELCPCFRIFCVCKNCFLVFVEHG